jgi:VanZ family protein
MSPFRSRTLAPWLLLAVIALIAYGSLYPFNLKPDANSRTLLDALTQLSWARAGRSDRVANVLLYLPLGFCLFLWLLARLRRNRAVALTVVLGSTLSLAIEIAQVYISSRVPSLTDLTLNTLGTLVGATGGLAWGAIAGWMHLPGRSEKPHRDPGAALVVGLWLAWRLAPFVPHFDLGKLKSALQPLFQPQIELVSILIYVIYWLVVSQALTTLVSRTQTLEALLLLIAAVLVGRLVVANQAFDPDELLALLSLLPLLVLMHRMTPEPRRVLLVVAMLAAFLFQRLSPFNFSAAAEGFDFWPFLQWFEVGAAAPWTAIDWVGYFETIFVFAALFWVLRHAGTSFRLTAGIALALMLGTELLQLWLPPRRSSITDPVVAVVVVMLFRYSQRRQRRLRI